MKTKLLTIALLSMTFLSSAQYKDSIKTFLKLKKSFEKTTDFVFIPPGSFVRGSNDSDIPTPDLNGYYFRSHRVSVDSFFMQKYEVSNAQYLEFVNDKIENDSVLGRSFLPDTLVWRSPEGYNEPYVEYYLRHPAYSNYPVVGVSYSKAVEFAEWQTKKYNSDENRIFKQVRFRIPTEEEWEYAAKGAFEYCYLPWGSNEVFDSKGNPRANFKIISQLGVYRDTVSKEMHNGEVKKGMALLSSGPFIDCFSVAGSLNDFEMTVAVDGMRPNPYGLYHMAGNVEEMVDAYYLRDPTLYSFTHDVRMEKSDQPWGVTKGGSWNDTGYYLLYPVRQFYDGKDSSSHEIGFRLVMEVLDY